MDAYRPITGKLDAAEKKKELSLRWELIHNIFCVESKSVNFISQPERQKSTYRPIAPLQYDRPYRPMYAYLRRKKQVAYTTPVGHSETSES